MDKEFLIKILHTAPRVVLPGFGAFLRKQQEGYVVFTPFLKSDDGFLSGQIEREYGVSVDDAREMIDAFVAHVSEVLRGVGRFQIEGVGSLVIDANGAISFVMDSSRQIPHTASSTATQQPQPKVEPQVEPKQVFEPKVTPQPQPQPQSRPEPTVQTPPPAPAPTPRPVVPQPITANRSPFTPPTTPAQPAPQPVRPPIPGQQRPPMPQAPQGVAPRPNPVGGQSPVGNPPQRPSSGQMQKPPHGARPGEGPRRERPLPKSPPVPRKKGKNDMWLVIAIVAALVAIGLLVFGFVTSNAASNCPKAS